MKLLRVIVVCTARHSHPSRKLCDLVDCREFPARDVSGKVYGGFLLNSDEPKPRKSADNRYGGGFDFPLSEASEIGTSRMFWCGTCNRDVQMRPETFGKAVDALRSTDSQRVTLDISLLPF